MSSSNINDIFDKHLNSLNLNTRSKILKLFREDLLFIPKYDISLKEEKARAQERLQKICDLKVVSVRDLKTNPENIFTIHEMVRLNFLTN